MKIAVIGAGAIGSLVAGYLTNKDEEVILVAHPQQYDAISQNGLRIDGVRGRFLLKLPVKRRLDERVNLVILATKTQDLEQAVSENLEYLREALILTTQNGIRAEEVLAKRLGAKNRLFASIVMFAATYLTPGKIVHNFEGNWILGTVDSDPEDALEKIIKVTSRIFPSLTTDEIMAMKWLKLFINANNCLAAILGKSLQQTFDNPAICKISVSIWREGWEVVNKAGLKLVSLPSFPLERISGLINLTPNQSAAIFRNIMSELGNEPAYGSILQSIKRNRLSEIDYINGEFVKLADSINQQAPLNKRLVEMVHSVEQNKQFFSEQELIKQTKEFLD